MKTILNDLYTLFLLLLLISTNTFSQSIESFVEDEIIVEVKENFSKNEKMNGVVQTDKSWFNKWSKQFEFSKLKPIFHDNNKKYYKINFNKKYNIDDIITLLKGDKNIKKVIKNKKGEYFGTDPFRNSQWGITKIDAIQAWSITSGTSDVIIAIIDSGIDLGNPILTNPTPHPDIVGNLWNGNGKYGLDANEYPTLIEPYDVIGHGTHVAGIAAGVSNNSLGIAGVAGGGYNSDNGATILAIKTAVNDADVATAIGLAVDNGAKIINLSLGWYNLITCDNSTQSVSATQEAIADALQNDVVVVVALGNNKDDISSMCPRYWQNAIASITGVISVANLDSSDIKSPTSNYADYCTISAPGQNILSTYPSYIDTTSPFGYDYKTGTSMAAPFVSGVAALIRSIAPLANRSMVEAILIETSDDISNANSGYLWSNKLGAGRVNAYNAVTLITSAPSTLQNFQVSFPLNQNPVLSWNDNNEADLKGYRVYKKYTTSSGTQTTSVFTSNNSYTDTDFTANFKFGNDEVEYWVVAEDIIGNYSASTQHISGDGTSNYQWKKASDEKNTITINDFKLFSNYPNPFNPSTQISYQLPKNSYVSLTVYNSLGQVVQKLVNKQQTVGKYTVGFNAEKLPSGVNLYKLQANEYISIKKMVLTK